MVGLIIATRPATFRVARSEIIAAPPADVFPHVNDLHAFQAWNPFARDPNARNTFEGPSAGPGAVFRWDGNSQVGAGAMTITDSQPDRIVSVHLEFLRPFKCTNRVEFTLEPNGAGTRITWMMTGDNTFVSKAMQLFMSMDKMVGGDFEKGLSTLKSLVENQRRP